MVTKKYRIIDTNQQFVFRILGRPILIICSTVLALVVIGVFCSVLRAFANSEEPLDFITLGLIAFIVSAIILTSIILFSGYCAQMPLMVVWDKANARIRVKRFPFPQIIARSDLDCVLLEYFERNGWFYDKLWLRLTSGRKIFLTSMIATSGSYERLKENCGPMIQALAEGLQIPECYEEKH